ncbi:YbhB/YbcL family Raf kinase inhibitor-like protein [Ascoidea rubescens DSM 1968]|uniref:Phosphatidylethanolamine-binding protein n=1 Tax=Ascoidea rubescens DSM 1968 TaxID=1344418 RepID=A0A1D2VD83_9ASCO|nr:phosphatidylethanolamine-binding protein [Ascoidea rubescens DSM 1968]ODV59595.1 phosphatidylethanolamine-binding protein [Ascoidea rubescens DSM 1968]
MFRPLVTISDSIIESLNKHEVFPDVLPEFKPKGLLTISYGKDKDVALGNTFSPDETQSVPRIAFTLNQPDSSTTSASSNKNSEGNLDSSYINITSSDLFTLVVTDPDAPSRTDKKWSEYCHYIASNLVLKDTTPGSASTDQFLSAELPLESSSNVTLIPYMGPGPPPKTGKHRYVFILFKQNHSLEPKAPSDRPNWGTGKPATGVYDWATKYGLEPYAVNFFYAQNSTQ